MSAWQNALDNALQAAGRGFEVFPLSVRKLPAIRSPHKEDPPGTPKCRGECGRPGHGVYDGTTDPDRIRHLFDLARHAFGYGIACGRAPHHLIGLDLDVKADENGAWELRRLAAKHGFTVPQTVLIRTHSGSWHAWWTGPADVKVPNSVRKLGPGIDVRGSGGYLVGPGSRGEGGMYTVASDPDDLTVRPVPEGLLRLMLAAKQRPQPERPFRQLVGPNSAGAALVGLVRYVLDAREGERNDRLNWAAYKAFEHAAAGRLDTDAAERALIRAAVEAGLSDTEAENTVASARGAIPGAAQ